MKHITQAYIECALWATDENGTLSPEAVEQMSRDCQSFIEYVDALGIDRSQWDDQQLGHDFWLSRNGHGTGFWDRGLPGGDALHQAAKTFGAQSLELDDNGFLQLF